MFYGVCVLYYCFLCMFRVISRGPLCSCIVFRFPFCSPMFSCSALCVFLHLLLFHAAHVAELMAFIVVMSL